MSTWKTSPEPNTEAALSAREDQLMQQLANASFERAAIPTEEVPVTAPQAVAPLPVHEVDAEHQALHAALQAGTIPTFADAPGTSPASPPLPIDVAAERETYAAFIAFINEHKDAGTVVTALDPEAYAQGLI